MNSRICYIVILLCFFACHSDRYQEKATRLYEYGIEIESFQPDSAAYLYRRALSLTSPNSDLSVALHLRLGNLLRTHHLYNRALEEHTIALKECMANDSTKYTARALREVGKDYLYKNSPDSALGYIKEALSLSEAASDTLEMTAAHNNLSVVYGELKDLEQATKHAYRAISLSKDSTLIYRTYSAIGKMFLLSGQYDSAYHYSRQGSLSPNIYTRANSYKQLCEVALETKNGALYEECVNLLNLANDSIEKINRTESMGETEYQYDLEQILYTEKTRYYRWIAVVIIGALLILFLYIQKRRSRDKAWKAQVEALRQKIETAHECDEGNIKGNMGESNVVARQVDNERKELQSLIDKEGDVCALSFMRTKAYKNMKSMIEAKSESVLSIDERQMVSQSIHKAFNEYIDALKKHTKLTQDEAVLCCLVKCGLNTKECAVCKGVSLNAIRTQKSRIKSKLM